MSHFYPTAPGLLGIVITRARTIAAACVLLIYQPCAAAPVQNQFTEGSQSLLVEFPNGSPSRYGFHPVKVTVVNAGSEPAAWEIKISDEGTRDDTLNSRGHRERIVVPPRRTVEREVLIAMGRRSQHSWSYRQVEVIKPSGAKTMWNPSNGSSRVDIYGVSVPALLAPQAVQKTINAPGDDDEFHGRMIPGSAPGDWRGYAAYGLVVLAPDDWQAMPAAARNALGDWTRMGGHLQFVDGMPDDAPAPDVPGKTERGLGGVHPPPTMDKPTFSSLPGAAAAKSSKNPAFESMETGSFLLQPWLARIQPELLRDRFTIWPMVLVLIAFFVMITPINLFVLAPTKRRHRLFRTIPVISLSACALLALAVGLGDGIGGKGQRLVWIESRPGTENRQYITQWQASRCGALIGTDFTVPDAAYISPLRPPGSNVTLSVQGDRLEGGGGWFTSRATQAHFLQTARPGRGRIEWSGKDVNAPSAVSTFDFPLRDIYVLREDGKWWHAPMMRQGEITALRPAEADELQAKLNTTVEDIPQRADMWQMSRRPGHFIAFTDEPPAIASLTSVRWKDTGIVTGALAAP
jgi:hypothetical protein